MPKLQIVERQANDNLCGDLQNYFAAFDANLASGPFRGQQGRKISTKALKEPLNSIEMRVNNGVDRSAAFTRVTN